ncbi:hypothetical protein NQ317_013472 [Molorchus minor]|uniref:RING-type E3 ubiquitin transferase n=1 Tax=Molorchus minor TaxID=1323400 RepID=A0ABQ9JG99_9CUCU|nr:hypothetical protein NQ317_013472 [Molorchus minor]
MAESRIMMNRPNSSSPPPNCAICLGCCTNKCFSDSCMHQFCFKCLLEWSKIKAECPLCKQPFRRIIHNVKSNEEYDEHVVEITPPEEIHIIDNEEFLVLPLTPSNTRHQFHFRTTFTVDTRGEHAIQQMLLSHPLTNGGQISIEGYAPGRNMYHRRRRDNTSTSFRRSIYTRNLWVTAPPDVTGRYRDVSPSFFRSCPGARTRLVPWLNRELNALLYENTQLVMRLVDIIMDHLLRHHICSRTFRNLLYDLPAPYIDVSDNDDSDVIIVGTTSPQEPVVIDLINSDSDEPILVQQEESHMPMPIPERLSEPENREPVLPLKLRLKHKRQTREKERRLRQKRKSRRHRSRSSSSVSSSSSSSDSSKSSYKREQYSSSSDTDLNVENTTGEESADDNLPLSAFTSRKKYTKKLKKRDRSYKKYSDYPTMSSSAKETSKKETIRIPQVVPQGNINMPSCSRYSSDSSPPRALDYSKYNKEKPPEPSNRENELKCANSSGLVNAPSCSKYSISPYSSSRDGTNSSNLGFPYSGMTRSDGETSVEDGYPLNHFVKSEVKDVRQEDRNGGPSGSSSNSNGRLRNILIKKEGSSNMWYTYPCNYDSDSSDN